MQCGSAITPMAGRWRRWQAARTQRLQSAFVWAFSVAPLSRPPERESPSFLLGLLRLARQAACRQALPLGGEVVSAAGKQQYGSGTMRAAVQQLRETHVSDKRLTRCFINQALWCIFARQLSMSARPLQQGAGASMLDWAWTLLSAAQYSTARPGPAHYPP